MNQLHGENIEVSLATLSDDKAHDNMRLYGVGKGWRSAPSSQRDLKQRKSGGLLLSLSVS